MAQVDIGLVGCGVMGRNLALNILSRGYSVAAYDTDAQQLETLTRHAERLVAADSLEKLAAALAPPRRLLLMVPAGDAVDAVLRGLLPLLDAGDVVIDGGNSHFADTQRRASDADARGVLYVGCGISGGEEGALRGPALMPGGSSRAWPLIEPILRSIAAKAHDGEPCCAWLGPGACGHFVKMVHNGIEYADMQLIGEVYHLLGTGLGLPAGRLHAVFADWNRGALRSYLIEITAEILAVQDADGRPLVDQILDTAGQKGTGKWTVAAGLELGQPITTIAEAVFGRCLSAMKDERVRAAELYESMACPADRPAGASDADAIVRDAEQALYAAKIASYAQGFQLLNTANRAYRWNMDLRTIARIWRGGCIIRWSGLDRLAEALVGEPGRTNLLLDQHFAGEVHAAAPAWRRVVATAVELGVPVPSLSAGLAYFDGYRSARLPANLLQAQRDYFGAHGYERLDGPSGVRHHTDWTAARPS